MSSFCVFGVRRDYCIAKAEKLAHKVGNKFKPFDEVVDKVFESAKPVQISPEYDAPAFATEFAALLQKSGIASRELTIRARGPKKDKSGKEVVSKATGKPVITWNHYETV